MKYVIHLTLLSLLILAGCASTEVKNTPKLKALSMTDAQLKSLLVGKTMVGGDWNVKLNSDGTAIGKSANSNDTGTYTIENGNYCSKWKSWGSGNKRCWSISKRSTGYYGKTVSGGGDSFKFTVK